MNMKKRNWKHRWNCICVAATVFCAVFGVFHAGTLQAQAKQTASAAKSVQAKTKKSAAKKTNSGKWKQKHGYYFYIRGGKRLRGLQKINGKYYYFSASGIQRTGWRQVNGVYRYFKIRNGKGGAMVTSQTVNGVTINRKGVAPATADTANRLSLLVRFQNLADQLVRPAMPKKEKLVTVFKYARDRNYRSIGSPAPVGNWDERLAEAFLNADWADCTMAAFGFAYLANAVGYTNISMRLYGHGHCEINRLIYDPGFAKTVSDEDYTRYFAKTYQQLAAWYTSDDTPTKYL